MARLKIMSRHGCLNFEQDIRFLTHQLCDMLPMIQVKRLIKFFCHLLLKTLKKGQKQVYTLAPDCIRIKCGVD